jgi:hypothetical protein
MRNVFLIGLIAFTGCQTPKPLAPQDKAAHAEEVEVLVALLKTQFPSHPSASAPLVLNAEFSLDLLAWPHSYRKFTRDLQAQARGSETLPDSLREYGYVPASAARDFCAKNAKQEPLWSELGDRLPLRLLGKKESQALFKAGPEEKPDGWDTFYAKYPGSPGIMTVSRVGFNEQHDTAVVYFGYQGHWLGGYGGLTVFRKMGGKWKQQPTTFGPMWVS